jgi:predicted dinucleotide-binding enzyme
MRIGIVHEGQIGAAAARLFAKADHDVALSFSRGQDRLAEGLRST